MQRLRVRFARGEAVKYVGHLDFVRFWERAVRRAALPLAYSDGHHPHPRMALAAPLPVGYTSNAELLELYLDRPLPPQSVLTRLANQMPPGIDVLDAIPVDATLPSLQSLMQACEYRVCLDVEGRMAAEVEGAIRDLLRQESIPWEWPRDDEVKRFDLRALVEDIWLEEWRGHEWVLGMRVVHNSSASGRPELVTLALGFQTYPRSIHRTKLVLRPAVPVPPAPQGRHGRGRPSRPAPPSSKW